MSGREEGRRGLELMTEILAARPHKDGHKLTEATQRLCAWREEMIARARGGPPRAEAALERLNAVISLVAALHFPLGQEPWDAFAQGRDALEGLLREEEGGGQPAGT